MQPAGVISQLGRYWVKSMRGESLPSAKLTLHGIEGDRSYAFVQAASRSSFPWLTARELPELVCYRAIARQGKADEAEITVVTPSGKTFPVASDDLRLELEARSGRNIYLLHDYRGSFDAAPLSLIGRQSAARIAEETGTQEDPWRFRPNLVVDLQSGIPFDELNWVGRIFRVGDTARIAITRSDRRCMIITLDPKTGKPSPNVLRSVAQQHEQCAGIYATVLTAGELHPGDPLLPER